MITFFLPLGPLSATQLRMVGLSTCLPAAGLHMDILRGLMGPNLFVFFQQPGILTYSNIILL